MASPVRYTPTAPVAISITEVQAATITDPAPSQTPATSTTAIEAKVAFYADKYNLNQRLRDQLKGTINCESQFISDVQSFAIDPKTGKREDSWGLAQINLPHNPTITREQAIDPDFALTFISSHFAQDTRQQLASRWTCYRILYGQ